MLVPKRNFLDTLWTAIFLILYPLAGPSLSQVDMP